MKYIIHNDFHIIKTYDTEQGAKSALTRKWKREYPNAIIMSQDDFDAQEPRVQVRNLMNGKIVELPKSQVGGCCDPSTERYWSM